MGCWRLECLAQATCGGCGPGQSALSCHGAGRQGANMHVATSGTRRIPCSALRRSLTHRQSFKCWPCRHLEHTAALLCMPKQHNNLCRLESWQALTRGLHSGTVQCQLSRVFRNLPNLTGGLSATHALAFSQLHGRPPAQVRPGRWACDFTAVRMCFNFDASILHCHVVLYEPSLRTPVRPGLLSARV